MAEFHECKHCKMDRFQEGDDAMISESRLVRSNHGAACLLELCLHRIDRSNPLHT